MVYRIWGKYCAIGKSFSGKGGRKGALGKGLKQDGTVLRVGRGLTDPKNRGIKGEKIAVGETIA